mmetsp:Transcript_85898/g.156540  ORF Transcript_85898/g.156540 Transcript_85898/m.156540 type:complete len:315 (+) Transcript_85898:58-1002(+)
MRVLFEAAFQLVFATLLPCSHGMSMGAEHSDRQPKPITRREPQHLSPESTWPFQPGHTALSPKGELILASLQQRHGHGKMKEEGEEFDEALLRPPDNSGLNTSAYCGLDYVLGPVNDTVCANTADHDIMIDPDRCIRAASETGAEANHSSFMVSPEFYYKRPKGCFALPCELGENGVCFYYNGIGDTPDTNLTDFKGRPVCSRQRFLNGTRVSGAPNPESDPSGCPDGYTGIASIEMCQEMASCRSYCSGSQFRVTEHNYTKHFVYPQGCFINEEDGCAYFNPPDDQLPTNPVGVPVCNVSTVMHFPEYGDLYS